MREDLIILPGLEGFVYKGPTYLELNKKLKSNPLVYNLIQQNIARKNNPTKEIVSYVDANGNTLHTTNVAAGVLSPVDPLTEIYVAGKILDPAFKIAGRAGEYGLARMGNNWARARILSRNINNVVNNTLYLKYPINLRLLERRPSRISETERLGIPKIERNFKQKPRKAYSGYTPTILNSSYLKFVDDVMLGVRWARARGSVPEPKSDVIDTYGLIELGHGAESRVYVDPKNGRKVIKVLRGLSGLFEKPTPREALKAAIKYTNIRNKAPFNLPLSVEGVVKINDHFYLPVVGQQRAVSIFTKDNIFDKIYKFKQSVLPIGGHDKMNNILLENGIEYASDVKENNLGLIGEELMGIDLALPGDGTFLDILNPSFVKSSWISKKLPLEQISKKITEEDPFAWQNKWISKLKDVKLRK